MFRRLTKRFYEEINVTILRGIYDIKFNQSHKLNIPTALTLKGKFLANY